MDGVKIKVFMSVWCHDSHREIPRLSKILEAIDFDEQNLEIVALNRAKKTLITFKKGLIFKELQHSFFIKKGRKLIVLLKNQRKV
jgi:thiol-disulfide isomerase/thioredoxin